MASRGSRYIAAVNLPRSIWPKHLAFAAIFLIVGIFLSAAAFLAWVKLYPENYDPKNINYVLWKHGLNKNMNLDDAIAGMTHDVWPVNIVKGMTKEQLKERFGYTRSLDETTPYLRLCYTAHDSIGQLGVKSRGKEVLFLRDGPWMVILGNGKAVDLVLCKGY